MAWKFRQKASGGSHSHTIVGLSSMTSIWSVRLSESEKFPSNTTKEISRSLGSGSAAEFKYLKKKCRKEYPLKIIASGSLKCYCSERDMPCREDNFPVCLNWRTSGEDQAASSHRHGNVQLLRYFHHDSVFSWTAVWDINLDRKQRDT